MSYAVDAILESQLEPLAKYLGRRGLVELAVNKPGEVALEFAGKGWVTEKAPELSIRYCDALCHSLANKAGHVFDPIAQPIVSTRLPGGHRFQAMMGKAVRSGIALSVRVRRRATATLEEFGVAGALKAQIETAMATGANIVISGGTSSGKTTLANLLLPLIPADRRILTIEDTAELEAPHRNQVNFLVSRNETGVATGYGDVFDHAMRSRPDQILLGELSIPNAFASLVLLNSGHRGFLTTIHANSPGLALDEGFYQRIALAGHREVAADYLAAYLRRTVDLVIQVAKVGRDEWRVTELWWPAQGEVRRDGRVEAAA